MKAKQNVDTGSDQLSSRRLEDGLKGRLSLFRVAAIAVIAHALWIIWTNRFLPMMDLPDWLYQGLLFKKLLLGSLPGEYSLKTYPVPYSVVTVALGLLDLVFKPEVAGKIVISSLTIGFVLSSSFLLKTLNPREDNPLLFVPLVFILNVYLFYSELAYVLGLAMFFFYCGILIRGGWFENRTLRWALFMVLMYFVHGFTWALSILTTLVVLAVSRRAWLIPRFVIAALPGALLAVWYVAARITGYESMSHPQFWTFNLYAGRYVGAFSCFLFFPPWLDGDVAVARFAALVNLGSCVAMIGVWSACAILWWRGRRENSAVLAAAMVCLVASVATGYQLGDFFAVGERFFYPSAWLAFTWLGGQLLPAEHGKSAIRLATVAMYALSILLIAQALYLDAYVTRAAAGLAAMYDELGNAPSRAAYCSAYNRYERASYPPPHRKGLDRFTFPIASAPRLPHYFYLEQETPAPLLKVGLFNYHGPPGDYATCQ